MSDKIPGSSFDNPIMYRGYRIYNAQAMLGKIAFSHEDYDGADDTVDNRHGYADSLQDAKEQIDEIELEYVDCDDWDYD